MLVLLAPTAVAQQAPFVPVTGPNAPPGATLLLRSSRGGIWMGGLEAGTEGLTYFDGSRFITPVAHFPKIIITGMVEDSGGGLWIAANSGIYRVFDGKTQRVGQSPARWGIVEVAKDVFITAASRSEGPVIKTDAVRISKRKGIWQSQTFARDVPATYFSVDRKGNVLFGCPGAYCEWHGEDLRNWQEGQPIHQERHPFMPARSVADSRPYRDAADCIWMANSPEGITYQCPSDAKPIYLSYPFQGQLSAPFKELPNGDLIVATMNWMMVGRPGHWQRLTPANGYPIAASLLAGEDETIWISNGNGLSSLSLRNQAEFWSERDGLNGIVWAVLPYEGRVFAASGNNVRVLDAGHRQWRHLASITAATLVAGPGHSILAGGESGVAQISANGMVLRKSDPVRTFSLAQTTDGHRWMGGQQISQLELQRNGIGLRWSGVPAGDQVHELVPDATGGLWACSSAGLSHRDAGGWHVLSKENGLLDNLCRSLTLDHSGGLWYSYDDLSAFSLIENPAGTAPRIRHFDSGGEVGTAANNFIHADRRGWLWRGTEDGIYVATSAQARAGQWMNFSRSDGLPSRDTNRRSLAEDRDGSIWLGMGTNVVHLSLPTDLLNPAYSPSVFISGFSLNGGSFQWMEPESKIEYGASLTAHIGSLQRDRRSAMRLRYRLLPDNAGWTTTRDLDLPLGKLRWGRHTLEVQARLFTGPWSATVRQAFSIAKPFWLQWPALCGLFFAAGGTAFGLGAAYRRRREKLNNELPELSEWREAILSSQTLMAPRTILDQRFEIGPLLASGGFAMVYKGADWQNGKRPCAIKIFRREFKERDWIVRRSQQEVSALTQIVHPNVVGIYGHGIAPDGAPYLVMEFIEGETLRETLNRSRLNRKRIAAYLRQAGGALNEIHLHNVCHRDVKPENLMIRAHGAPGSEVVLIDFSIAVVKDPDQTMHGLSRAAGTLLYMAPEQGIGYAEPSTDIYSLTKVLLEMLTGKRMNSLLPDASIDLPARVREFLDRTNLGLSTESVNLIAAALEFHPSARPRDAAAFSARIAQDLEQSTNL